MATLGCCLLRTATRLSRACPHSHFSLHPQMMRIRCTYGQRTAQVYLNDAASSSSSLHSSARCHQESDIPRGASMSRLEKSSMVLSKSLFEEGSQDAPNKEAFKDIIKTFTELDKRRRGHIQFIETALRYMKPFGVEKDVDAYNRLLDVFPKGKFVPKNAYQSMFNHYPEQQVCGIKVLQQMEDNAVLPNNDTKEVLISVFGRKAHPVKKYQRLMYWFPKFRNINPFPLPKELPTDPIKLSELGLKRMSEYEAEMSVFSINLNTNETSVVRQDQDYSDLQGQDYIASMQSPDQKEDLAQHQIYRPLYVEGPYTLWLKETRLSYYVLRAEPWDIQGPVVYEQGELPPSPVEGNVYAMCMTSEGSRDALNEWIKRLQDDNPHLARLTVVFNLFDKKSSEGGQESEVHHIGEGPKLLSSS